MSDHEYKGKIGTRTFHESLADHTIEITVMGGGGIRVECSCSVWKDFGTEEMFDATKFASLHIKDQKLKRKNQKMDERLRTARLRSEARKNALGK